MKVDIYHIYRHFDYANLAYPIIINVLKAWAEEVGWQARVAVCNEEEVDLATDADVVAFSVYTQTAPAVYRLSSRLRRAGKIVIFGGPHFRGPNYHEGLGHCDVLVESINQQQWKQLLREIEEGAVAPAEDSQARYIQDSENLFEYPDNLVAIYKKQPWYQLASIPTSLGCPFECPFCNPYQQGTYKVRDIELIYHELTEIPRWRPVFFADATFGLNRRHTLQLMERIAPLKMNLLVESTLGRLQDDQMLDSMARGGVKWITVGVESLNLRLDKLGTRSVEESFRELLNKAHDRGMMVEGNFICGLDEDGPEFFDRVFEFYATSTLDIVIIDILTPYPNTTLFGDLQRANRIIDTNWEHYDYRHVVFKPKRMTADELIDGFNELYRNLFSGRMTRKKLVNAFRSGGVSVQTFGVIFGNVWSHWDRRRKERELNENRCPAEPCPAHQASGSHAVAEL